MRDRRAGFGRRARWAAAWALGLFVAGEVGANWLIDHACPTVRFPAAARVIDKADDEPGPPALAFLGDSRVMAAVDAPEANRVLAAESGKDPPPRVLNAAVPAGDALSTEFVYDQLLRAGHKPAWLVIDVSPEVVGARNPFLAHQVLRQPTWAHLADWPTLKQAGIQRQYLEARLVPVYAYRQPLTWELVAAVRGGRPERPPDETPKFLPPMEGTEAERRERLEFGVRYWIRPYLEDYRITGPMPAALERTLARCRSDGVSVILLGIPQCSVHRAAISPGVAAEYRAYLDRLIGEYGCRLVEAREWMADDEFHDATHLSLDGRMRFTRRFTREVVLPVVGR